VLAESTPKPVRAADSDEADEPAPDERGGALMNAAAAMSRRATLLACTPQ